MLGIKRSRPPARMPVSKSRGTSSPATQSLGFTVDESGMLVSTAATFGGPASIVTEDTALALPAAWRCLNIIMNGIGILNLYACDDRTTEQEGRIEPNPPVLTDPWPLISAMNWKVQVTYSLVMRGNAYCLQTDLDPANGYPRQLPIINPDVVNVEIVDGMPIYWIDGNGPYGPLDVLHMRGPMFPGDIVGMGIIDIHRMGLGYALDLARYGSATYGDGAVPPVVLHVNRPELSREQAQDIQNRWMAAHGFGQRTPAVVPNTINVETVAFSPEDAEYIQAKIQSATEVCWMFGVDPRNLAIPGGQGSLTYSNLEMAANELARDSFMPWTTRIEQNLTRVLPRHQDARFDFNAMLRPTTIDRYNVYKIAVEQGILTIDEVRKYEDLGPIADAPGYEPPQAQPPQLQNVMPINPTPAATGTEGGTP